MKLKISKERHNELWKYDKWSWKVRFDYVQVKENLIIVTKKRSYLVIILSVMLSFVFVPLEIIISIIKCIVECAELIKRHTSRIIKTTPIYDNNFVFSEIIKEKAGE